MGKKAKEDGGEVVLTHYYGADADPRTDEEGETPLTKPFTVGMQLLFPTTVRLDVEPKGEGGNYYTPAVEVFLRDDGTAPAEWVIRVEHEGGVCRILTLGLRDGAFTVYDDAGKKLS